MKKNKKQESLEYILLSLYNLDWGAKTTNDIINLTYDLRKEAKNIIKQCKRKKEYKITVELEDELG